MATNSAQITTKIIHLLALQAMQQCDLTQDIPTLLQPIIANDGALWGKKGEGENKPKVVSETGGLTGDHLLETYRYGCNVEVERLWYDTTITGYNDTNETVRNMIEDWPKRFADDKPPVPQLADESKLSKLDVHLDQCN